MERDEIKKLEFELWIRTAEITSFMFLTSAIMFFTVFDLMEKYPNFAYQSIGLGALFYFIVAFAVIYCIRKSENIINELKVKKK